MLAPHRRVAALIDPALVVIVTSSMSLKIVGIKRPRRTRGRTRIELSDGSVLELATEVAIRSPFSVGDTLQTSDVAALQGEDEAWRCKESALRLLSFRSRSEAELRRRLRARDFPAEVVDRCVADLLRAGLLDDAAFARALARDRARAKPVGKIRLKAELRAKGVDPEIADDAIGETISAEAGGELDLARRAAAKFRRRTGEDALAARRRLYGFLARRGFAPETVQAVVEEAIEGED